MERCLVNTARKYYLLPATQNVALTPSLRIYNSAGVEVSGSPFSGVLCSNETLGLLGVYESEEITLSAIGRYYYVWSDDGVKLTGEIEVLREPVADQATNYPEKYRHSTPGFVACSDLVLRVFDDSGSIVDVFSTQETAVAGVYETIETIALTEAGTYLFLWTSESGGYAFADINTVTVLQSNQLRTIKVFVIDTEAHPQQQQVNVEVLLSKLDGTPVQKALTNLAGKALLTAVNGDYVVSVRKSGVVFSKNNKAVTVVDPSNVNANIFYLYTTPFTPTFDIIPLLNGSSLSKMVLRLARIDGSPVGHTSVLITPSDVATYINGYNDHPVVIATDSVLATTDGNGYAECYLLRGTTVTITLEGFSIRRTFEVPDETTFDFSAALSENNDGFDVVQINTQTAMRTSL